MFGGQRPTPLALKRNNMTTRDLRSEPSSPVSLSWTAEKSTAELVVLLKNAHASLREKDEDLTLAAELGHYLLEKNTALKLQYDELLRQQEQHSECNDLNCDSVDNDNTLVLLSQQQAHQRVLADLQDKNMELQRLLDDAQYRSDKLQTVHDKKARELEYDITLLKDHLEMAARRIEEMEDDRQYQHPDQRHHQCNVDNQRQKQKQHRQQQQKQHDTILVELRDKINQLEYENSQLVHTRQLVQARLDKALTDVDTLQTQCHLDEWTREHYNQLNNAYHTQFNQIAQLNESLEDHRQVLANLVDHDTYDDHGSTPSTDFMLNDTKDHRPLLQNDHNNNNLMAELEKVWHRDQLLVKTVPEFGATNQEPHQQQQQQSFSGGNQHGTDDDDDDDDDGYSSLVSDGIKLHQQNSFGSAAYINDDSPPPPSVLDHALISNYTDNSDSQVDDHVDDDDDDYTNDGDDGKDGNDDGDLFGPQDMMDALTSYNLYPDLPVATEEQQPKEPSSVATTGMVHKAQRWCRFALVLTVAALINAFEGPDTMLDELY